MTTMFVQLRRVVYLLVLLQCCTCVAYAQDDERMTDEDEKHLQGMTKLRVKMAEEKKKVEAIRVSVNTVKKEWSEVSKCAQNATTTANEVRELLMETKGRILYLPENENEKNMSELKEVLRKAVDASKEITVAADNASLTAKKISNLTQEIQQGQDDLFKVIGRLTWTANNHIDKKDEKIKIKQFAEECKKEAKEVENFVLDVQKDSASTFSLAETAEKQAAVASDAAAELQRIINVTYLECPDMKEELDREIEEEKRRLSETNTTNEGENSPHNNKELDDSHPNKQNETGSHANAQQQQNQQNSENKNEESNVETQENNNSSQSKTPTPSDSSASGSSPSQNTPTNTSSSSNRLDNTQLSDSSSSPALAHSPLLLLLVSMCVLGCTAVF